MSGRSVVSPIPIPAQGRSRLAVGTYVMVLALIVVMLVELIAGVSVARSMFDTFGLRSSAWSWADPAAYGRLLSYSLLHAGAAHSFWNTILLLLVGCVIERRAGLAVFAAFMVVGSITAAAAHLALFPAEARPLVGVSGAVSALFGAAFVIAGEIGVRLRLSRSGRWVSITLRRLFIIWLVIQAAGVWLALMPGQGSASVAYWSHLAGFGVGVVGALIYRKMNPDEARASGSEPAMAASFARGGD